MPTMSSRPGQLSTNCTAETVYGSEVYRCLKRRFRTNVRMTDRMMLVAIGTYTVTFPFLKVMSPGRWKRPNSISAPPTTIISTPTTSSSRPASATPKVCALQESRLVRTRVWKLDPQVAVGEVGRDPSSCRPGEESDLDQ